MNYLWIPCGKGLILGSILSAMALFLSACTQPATDASSQSAAAQEIRALSGPRPNLLVIMVDDLGYSDLGAFGGDIETPAIDRLALEGVRLGAFYTAPTCSPTRAALLSGTDPHIAGLGNMAELLSENQRGQPGYEGHLNNRVVSVASLLRDAGYHTTMTGKWHLGLEEAQSPAARGFTHSFALLHGGAGHFDDVGLRPAEPKALYRENGLPAQWPTGRYSSDFYTEKLIEYLKKNDDDKPFFAYLAFTAVHWPLQAPDELIEKYRGRYDEGWDALRKQRLSGLQHVGLLTAPVETVPPPGHRSWDSLSQEEQSLAARKMEVYAAMVDSIDQNVQRLVTYLKDSGELDNTTILFLSDNGAEGTPLENSPMLDGWIERFDNSLENMGRHDSYIFYGPSWAHASTAPGKHYKSHVSEGGVHVPAFIWRKDMVHAESIALAPATVMDIAPTLLDIAQIQYPKTYRGKPLSGQRGFSLQRLIDDPSAIIHAQDAAFGMELFGRKALRQGKWKLYQTPPPFGSGEWELYNVEEDLGESNNVAAQHSEIVAHLTEAWNDYAREVGVVLPKGPSGY
ncbi:MAG: arylsulfatase [Halioglobus sp.]